MSGLLALLGGGEHLPGCEPIDRYLLDHTRASAPTVVVVPFASSLRTRARTVGLAVEWWERLGAQVLVCPPVWEAEPWLFDRADVIALTGGVPDRLHGRLADTALWGRIARRWRAGAHLAGSSSGAMVLGAWRQAVRPPFAVRPGLGLVPGVAVAPHHERPAVQRVARLRASTHPHLTILGIDERTALVGRDGQFRVLGRGRVEIHRGAWRRRLDPGDDVDLGRLWPRPAPTLVRTASRSAP